jgi:hypothetical protein
MIKRLKLNSNGMNNAKIEVFKNNHYDNEHNE